MSNELKGNDFLLQIEDPLNPGTYNTVSGLRTNSATLNGEAVDTTSKGTNGWRRLLNGAGVNSIDLSGEGVTERTDIMKRVFTAFKARNFVNARLSMKFGAEDVVVITGAFKITAIELSGEQNKEVPYSLSLMSANEPDFQIL